MIAVIAKIGLLPSEIGKQIASNTGKSVSFIWQRKNENRAVNTRREILKSVYRMRTITNNSRDAHALNLGTAGERGPYLVTQTGVSPTDPRTKEWTFHHIPFRTQCHSNAFAGFMLQRSSEITR